ncbi:MAG: hypothetical protein HC916_13580 [Coleofasciculaceae cyanobacterium SM2_1_6]|nr:hypothetical protein [Coleofasciculaceae cyanobacterium SM2_1_6]
MNNEIEQELNAIISSIKEWLQAVSGNILAIDAIANISAETPVSGLDLILDPLEWEDLDPTPAPRLPSSQQNQELDSLDPSGSTMVYKSNWGEIPTVQKRFQSILKQRIQTEMDDDRLPLFPWETSISDYELEEPAPLFSQALNFSALQQWMPQLNTLSVRQQLPESVLAQILRGCFAVIATPRKLGGQIVKAVGELFPEEGQALNDVAGLVLAGGFPGRGSGVTAAPEIIDYAAATPDQQMALSLMAAKQIIDNLTLFVSTHHPQLRRQWQTIYGNVDLQLSYHPGQDVSKRGANPSLRLQVWLPKGGRMTIDNSHGSVVTERAYPGYVSAELFDLQPSQLYPLEIRLLEGEQTPLSFAISILN